MKLTNLSLAIMVAVGVAACGGSGDNNSNKPQDNRPKPNQPQTDNKPKPPADAGKQIVDPTGTQVVDDKDLTKQNTVGTLQYVRRDDSQYDRANNPSKPASASPLLGVTLNDQNPSLTNIVLARQNLTRTDGTPVKAQFTGSDNPIPLKLNGEVINDSVTNHKSLQEENFNNVDVLAGQFGVDDANKDGVHTEKANNLDKDGKQWRTPAIAANTIQFAGIDDTAGAKFGTRKAADTVKAVDAIAPAANKIAVSSESNATEMTAIIDPLVWQATDANSKPIGTKYTGKDKNGKDVYLYRGDTGADGKKAEIAQATKHAIKVSEARALGTRFGKDLVWWTAPETAFENLYTRNGVGDPSQAEKDEYDKWTVKAEADSKAATNGLIRVGGNLSTLGQELNWNKEENKWENHHNTTSRIFGRYHLAYADTTDSKKGINPVALNSFSGAKSFIAEVAVENGVATKKATQYSIGAVPITLKNVQYGRVTTNLDVDAGEGKYPDGFIRSPFRHKDDTASVDNYFYRGTNATTIEQMAALPSNQIATYHGHALMYGIDNSFHGGGNRNLPNAFAGATDGIGLGNFVEAQANFGTKRMIGKVYNEWLLDASKAATVRDNLVQFQGNIIGNTVVGTADRVYIAGDDNATFKASFFGEKAEELGGSFNSVADKDKYGNAYGSGDWGGVFGATKGSATSNTFQGDDGKNNYGSL